MPKVRIFKKVRSKIKYSENNASQRHSKYIAAAMGNNSRGLSATFDEIQKEDLKLCFL